MVNVVGNTFGAGLASPGFGEGFGQGGGRGFGVVFDAFRSEKYTREMLEEDAVLVSGASVEAVVATTNEVKELIRAYLDANFTGSSFIGGSNGRTSRRRVSFAASQSRFYDDREERGQYTGLIYSKFGRGNGPASFVDFLLLHVRGGTITPTNGEWIRLGADGATGFGQVGKYKFSGSQIFFAKSKDGQKLFLLRKKGKGKNAATELIATLVKKIVVPATLSGIDAIAARREDLFYGHFAEALEQRGGLN